MIQNPVNAGGVNSWLAGYRDNAQNAHARGFESNRLVSSTTDELLDTTSAQHRHSTEFPRLVLWVFRSLEYPPVRRSRCQPRIQPVQTQSACCCEPTLRLLSETSPPA